jgi:hypothetical protein
VQLSTFALNGRAWWGAVSQFQPNIDVNYLRSIQHAKDGYTVDQKMRWLGEGQEKGRPYLQKSTGLAFGTIAFGGQLIELEAKDGKPVEYYRKGQYPNRDTDETILFYRPVGLRKADFGKYTHATHPHLIQRATSAYPGNYYEEFSRGEVLHVVWDWRDFPHNEVTREPGLYIAAAFLEDL